MNSSNENAGVKEANCSVTNWKGKMITMLQNSEIEKEEIRIMLQMSDARCIRLQSMVTAQVCSRKNQL